MYKYDRKTHKEIPYTPQAKGGNYPVYSGNMSEVINCAQCGKEITFGEGYTSREIFSGPWIDYPEDGFVECPFCHSATNCDGNRDELHYCFSCGSELR